MKNIKISIVAGLLLASTAAFGGISGSPHDLSATATGTAVNGELCVFCHTPHAGASGTIGAPLWNKEANLSAAGAFKMYGATSTATNGQTIAQTDTGVSDPSNSSLACLSCHDGVNSIDSIVNAPGSGKNSIGTSTLITSIGVNENANLTQNLTNTHPISIEYIPGNASLRAFDANLTDQPGNVQAWVGATTIQDLLRGSGSDRIECGSCHDPHNGYGAAASDLYGTGVQDRTTEVNFLRHSNKASALCLGCHGK